MDQIAIRAEGLSKRYRLGQRVRYKALRDTIMDGMRAPFRILQPKEQAGSDSREFWALKDISFEIHTGEATAIIGRNGAGKSTLLKILSRITAPTRGRADIFGRVGSLLEVGTGFHPELTGRENIFLNGAIIGMRRVEIIRNFDAIVAFAEIEQFLDTPVKFYSSGMYVRLAFAVASHFEPDILLIDEVLAVGDAQFQKKCLGRMAEVAGKGRTVLFVSHNMTAVQALCSQGILLGKGHVELCDKIEPVVQRYLAFEQHASGEEAWSDQKIAPGNHQVRLKAVRVVSRAVASGSPNVEDDITIEVDYWNLEANARRLVSVHLTDALGAIIFTSANMHACTQQPDNWVDRPYPVGLFRTRCIIPKLLLKPGPYSIRLYINGTMTHDTILCLDGALSFDVRESKTVMQHYQGAWIGAIRPILHWETERLE